VAGTRYREKKGAASSERNRRSKGTRQGDTVKTGTGLKWENYVPRKTVLIRAGMGKGQPYAKKVVLGYDQTER